MEKHHAAKDRLAQQAVVRKITLNYYNNYLLQHGVITRDEHRKMAAAINSKYNKNLP